MRLDPAPLCLRNDGGTLCWGGDYEGRVFFRDDSYRKCDVCGQRYTVELLEGVVKSTWEALRLGCRPVERRPHGLLEMELLYSDKPWMPRVYIQGRAVSEEHVAQRFG